MVLLEWFSAGEEAGPIHVTVNVSELGKSKPATFRPMSNPPRPGTVPPRPPGTPPNQPQGTPPPPQGRAQGTPPPRPAAPAQPARPVDLATRLDGQRSWLNELDNSLRKRSIVALVLTCLAVGVGAAAMYIAITKNSDSDRITALETRISALEAASTGTVPETTVPETGTTGTTEFGVPVPDGTEVPTGATGVTDIPAE